MCLLVEANAPIGPGDRFIADARARASRRPPCSCVNKIDAAGRDDDRRAPRAARRSSATSTRSCRCRRAPATASTRSSASSRRACPRARTTTRTGVVTDQPETFLAAELVREKLLGDRPRRAAALDHGDRRGDRAGRRGRRAARPGGDDDDPAHPGRRPGRAGLAEGDRDRQGRRGARRPGPRPARSSRRCSAPGCTSRRGSGSSPTGSAAPHALDRLGSLTRASRRSRGRPSCSRREAPAIELPRRVASPGRPGSRAPIGRGDEGRRRAPKRSGRRSPWSSGPSSSARVACSPAAANDNGQNSLQPERARRRRQIDNLFIPIFWIAVVDRHRSCSPRPCLRRLQVPLPRGQDRQPEADPRQHPARDRLDDRPRADPRGHRGAHDQPRSSTSPKEPKPAPTSRGHGRSASSGGGSSSYHEAGKVVTANEITSRPDSRCACACRRCEGHPHGAATSSTRFWVPELRARRTSCPAATTQLSIEADKPGTYLGQCAEYCGLSHANMRFRVIAKTPADYEAGSPSSSRRRGAVVDATDALRGRQELIATKYGCTNCHTFDDSSEAAATGRTSRTSPAGRRSPSGDVRAQPREPRSTGCSTRRRMIPMQSKQCRLSSQAPIRACVGMPSFTKDTPRAGPG